jgi:hypothetical protein
MVRMSEDATKQIPQSYSKYDSANIPWGVLENYEIVHKIGEECPN